MNKDEALAIPESLFADNNFVSFARMERAPGRDRHQVIMLKPALENILRAEDGKLTRTSIMKGSSPGFFPEGD